MLTKKDIIETLCEFEIVRNNYMVNDGEVDYDKKIIYINPDQSYGEMKDTVVHELLHTAYDKKGIDKGEESIVNESSKLVKELFK